MAGISLPATWAKCTFLRKCAKQTLLCASARKCSTQNIGQGAERLKNPGSPGHRSEKVSNTMSCWQVFDYGGPEKLKLSHTIHVPALTEPREMLIRVHAASVNPIDTKMIGGYGSKLFNVGRRLQGKLFGGMSEFPFIPGMDFSGEVIEIGKLIPRTEFSPGDQVWGTIQYSSNGTHAQYTTAKMSWVSHKPASLSHIEAASIPYAAATTWSALFNPPKCLTVGDFKGKRVLILGGSGGVGSFAIQLLKAWGADLTVVCGSKSLERVLTLGADIALDYNKYDVKKELKEIPRFDVIYDLVGKGTYDYTLDYLKEYENASYISIVNPVLTNFDKYGLVGGFARTVADAGFGVAKNLPKGRQFHWGFHQPSSKCMKTVAKLVDEGKILPVVEKVYPFEALPEAYAHVNSGSKMGKIVVDFPQT